MESLNGRQERLLKIIVELPCGLGAAPSKAESVLLYDTPGFTWRVGQEVGPCKDHSKDGTYDGGLPFDLSADLYADLAKLDDLGLVSWKLREIDTKKRNSPVTLVRQPVAKGYFNFWRRLTRFLGNNWRFVTAVGGCATLVAELLFRLLLPGCQPCPASPSVDEGPPPPAAQDGGQTMARPGRPERPEDPSRAIPDTIATSPSPAGVITGGPPQTFPGTPESPGDGAAPGHP